MQDHENAQNTPGPARPGTRQIVAWTLILALVLAAPLSYLAGSAGSGGRILAVLLVVVTLVGGMVLILRRR
ncbi:MULTISPECIES: hypothetical protein [Pseudonocardia]|uniref:Uncharacterized protein n=2 Tax=Pseudonocardia TaxID=1847 RepID=A0A1Y2MXF8_PSEAH|nr:MULTISPECIES: hypothetical protein [Pseudonocardia]OSY39852.1 hypothetical protein BG845_03087 [Pseudonocardia autotrophica]TDN74448.1 hypothetical protein C8E95_3571 [Pseudonocardia autotrophica]BBG05215.1 hypothetical protein Pdca_64240 [Pseudonocardia autotrophica]GEC25777.1 hypothetical protein PSA01_28060 [Pseudonocardia saturnea]